MGGKMAGEVRFTPTEADYVAVRRDLYRQCLRTPRLRLIYGMIPVLALILGVSDAGADPLKVAVSSLVYVLVGTTVSAALIGLSFASIPAGARRQFRQSKLLHQEFHYGWSDTGFEFSSAFGSGRIPWNMLHGWLRTRSNMLLYTSPSLCHFVPLRLLSQAEAEDLQGSAVRAGVKRV